MKTSFFILIFGGIALSSCYYDVDEQLYSGSGPCDTSGINYFNGVLPILQGNGCLGCHSGGASSGNISLEGFNNVRVVAQNGRLLGAISHIPGFSPMPQGGNKLSACNINKVKAWIDAGTPNN